MYFIVAEKNNISEEKEMLKAKIFMREISIIILIYRKLGSVGAVQQKIKYDRENI